MAEEELIVRGLTGVDIRVRIAGLGTRSYAFVTDWLLRTLLALGWLLLGALLRLMPAVMADRRLGDGLMLAVAVLALATYFLYHPVLETVMRGRTPGLRKAGARIVTVEGATPGTGPILIRNLFRLIDCLPVFYMVGLACCMLTKQRVRLGDLAAGTVMALDEADSVQSLGRLSAQMQQTGLPLDALRLIHDLLDRWPELAPQQRIRVAGELLHKLDPGFDSRVSEASGDQVLRGRLEALLAGPRH